MKIARILSAAETEQINKMILIDWKTYTNKINQVYERGIRNAYYIGAKKDETYIGGHANSFFWLNGDDEQTNDSQFQLSSTYTNWRDWEDKGAPVNQDGNQNCVVTNIAWTKNYNSWDDVSCFSSDHLNSGDHRTIGALCQLSSPQCFLTETRSELLYEWLDMYEWVDITDLDSINSYLAKDCSEEHSKEVASDNWCGRLSVLDPTIINYYTTMGLIISDYPIQVF